MTEPTITINGAPLSVGQSMTVRAAIETLAADLDINGCGDDEHGKQMTDGYLARINEIRELMRKGDRC